MITVAITGGIGSGKSTVTNYLENKGYIVIDADKMSREMTSAGGKAMPYIAEHFGTKYITSDGSMNRAAMRDLVFNNPEAKKLLEEGTTKVILEDIESIKKEMIEKESKVLFFDIPQLFEQGIEKDYDQVWSVIADREIKKERVKQRDNIPDDILDIIIDTQLEDDYRIDKSSEIIYNNGTKEQLYNLIDKLIIKYNF